MWARVRDHQLWPDSKDLDWVSVENIISPAQEWQIMSMWYHFPKSQNKCMES